MGSRLGGDLYMGYRAIIAQPLRWLFGRTLRGKAHFLDNYGPEGLVPTPPEDKAMLAAAARCISCGLCDQLDGQLGALARETYDGTSLLPRQYARSSVELVHARAAIEQIDPERYRAGAAVCPTGVPLVELAYWLRDRLARARV